MRPKQTSMQDYNNAHIKRLVEERDEARELVLELCLRRNSNLFRSRAKLIEWGLIESEAKDDRR